MKPSTWVSLLALTGVGSGCGSGEQDPISPGGVSPSAVSSTTTAAVTGTSEPVTSPVGPTALPSSPAQPSGAPAESTLGPGPLPSSTVPAAPSGSSGPTSSVEPTPSTPTPSDVCEPDTCPFENGISNGCTQRFALGVNYAWHDFGADFGGLAQWSLGGITAQRATIGTELAEMKANGVSVIRWWMFPDFRGDGVEFDAEGNPSGLSAKAVEDIQTALELAAEHDLYIVLTLFSFDNFRPSRAEGEVDVPGMTPMVTDATRRAKLIDNVVRPAALAAAQAPHASRLLGWDVINEPEWAIQESGLDDQDFTPNEELDAVPLDDMKALINESLAALDEVTPDALLSVGWAAAKWAWAFQDIVAVDFHQPHIYGWVNTYWPYTESPSDLGYTGKPTVMGEFYMLDMPFAEDDDTPFGTIVESWYGNGYAGAWAWSYTDMNSGPEHLPLIKAFADSKGCPVAF